MIISECECCGKNKELKELVVESEMCGSCEEYSLGMVCKECRKDKSIVNELLRSFI